MTQKELHDSLTNVRNKCELREIEDAILNPTFIMEKLTELEDRSRQNNARINDIPETSNKTRKNCEEEVRKIIRNKLDNTDDIEIDCCHRMDKFQRNKSKPRTVVSKFLRSKDKHKILLNAKKLKDTGMFIYEDFSKVTIELRKYLWKEVLQDRQQNKIAYLKKHCCRNRIVR